MLVLTLRREHRIFIGDNITIVYRHGDSNAISIGIDAPKHIQILRDDAGKRTPLPERNPTNEGTPESTRDV